MICLPKIALCPPTFWKISLYHHNNRWNVVESMDSQTPLICACSDHNPQKVQESPGKKAPPTKKRRFWKSQADFVVSEYQTHQGEILQRWGNNCAVSNKEQSCVVTVERSQSNVRRIFRNPWGLLLLLLSSSQPVNLNYKGRGKEEDEVFSQEVFLSWKACLITWGIWRAWWTKYPDSPHVVFCSVLTLCC